MAGPSGSDAWAGVDRGRSINAAPPTASYGDWAPPQPRRRRGLFVTLVVLACIAALAFGAGLGMLTAPGPAGGNGEPTAVTAPAGVYETVSDLPGRFTHAGTLTQTTSVEFTANVARAYYDTGADGASTQVSAYSPATERTYELDCQAQPEGTVLCTGGRNARIVLWP